MTTHPRSRGFTLIELLVVITIIAVMTGIILNTLSGSRAKARDSQRVSDLGQLQLALALFVDKCGQYPVGIAAGSSLTTSLTAPTCPTNTFTGAAYKLGDFIGTIPTPPAGAGQTYYNTSIYYTTSRAAGTGVTYIMVAALESDNQAMQKSLQYSAVTPVSTDSKWWPPANASPFTYCGGQNGTYSYYCLGSN